MAAIKQSTKGEMAMSDKMVVKGSTVSARQLKDFFRQIDDGSLTGTMVQAILEHRDPFTVSGTFRRDMRKEGWTLLENVPRRLNSAIDGISFLKGSEKYINGEEVVRRARTGLDANYGQEDAEWLLDNRNMIPAELRKYYLVFPGTIWRGSTGGRCFPCLNWNGFRWCLSFGGLGDDWSFSDRLGCGRK
jgi:hypothetical protein